MSKLNNMIENTEKNTERVQNKNLKPPWKKGEVVIGAGRPPGKKNYATLREEAIIQMGKDKGLTAEEVDVLLVKQGVTRAINGDYRFYRDDLDRTHGTALMMSKVEHSGKVEVDNESSIDLDKIAREVAEKLKEIKTHGGNTNKVTVSES